MATFAQRAQKPAASALKLRRKTAEIESMSDERAFLHDIATPIAVAYGMVEAALDALNARPDVPGNAAEIARLEKALKALDRLVALLKARREVVASSKPAA